MKKVELVFIPSPGIGHLVSTLELARHLLDRDERLSVTLLVIPPPRASGQDTHGQAFAVSDVRIRCINVPPVEPPSFVSSPEAFYSVFIENHKPLVEHIIMTNLLTDDSIELTGLVVDLFCTSMIDIAQKIGVPSYLFFTSCAAFLGLMLYLPGHYNQVGAKFSPSDPKPAAIPTYVNPVPTNVLPSCVFNEDGYTAICNHSKRFNETKGIIINTFAELEVHAINSIKARQPVYTVGPLIDLKGEKHSSGSKPMSGEIMTWLADQPPSSVVFLCFGSIGSFDAPQLEQIAMALEVSGVQFLWSIRHPPPKDKLEFPSEYQNLQEALPDGFLERTKKRGMVCGWAPQVDILAHPAIGGFVSHCGWNSILESLWYGIPIATWPLYAEQQINAFELVWELEMAVELKLDSSLFGGKMVMADEIERAIKCLMEVENPLRRRVKEVSGKSRKAVKHGGSSYASLGQLVEEILGNRAVGSPSI